MPWLTPDGEGAPLIVRRLLIPFNYVEAVNGAIWQLTRSFNWEKFGTTTPEEASARMYQMYLRYMEFSVNMIGSVFPFLSGTVPDNALPCDGSTYNRVDYPELYAVLDAAFIIDADTFITPDLRGLTVIGAGTASVSGTTYAIAETGGTESVTLDESQIPAHSHGDAGHVHSEIAAVSTLINGGLEAPASAALPVATSTGIGYANIQNTGGDGSHENRQPFMALKYAVIAR